MKEVRIESNFINLYSSLEVTPILTILFSLVVNLNVRFIDKLNQL